jgi:hypothetical protein
LTDLSGIDINLVTIINHVQKFYMKIDNEIAAGQDSSWLFLGHYIVMILDCTNMLKRCYDEKNYRSFSNFK